MPLKSKTSAKTSVKTSVKTSAKTPAKTSKSTALPPPRKWAKCHERFLVPELRRRSLPTLGDQSTLVARLKATDSPALRTPAGRKAAYEKQVKRLQNAALKNITPFPQFQKLPLEIREKIWEFSLPGPRVLTLDTNRGSVLPLRLRFSQVVGWKNPVALKTCRESRTVALRRYRLAFGTPNVYFDFEGGDILYLGPECQFGRFLDQDWDETQRTGVPQRLNSNIIRDLESVRHLAISRELWNCRYDRYGWFGYMAVGVPDQSRGDLLRKKLRKFKGVQRISFEGGMGKQSDYGVFSGGVEIEDPWFEKRPRDWRIGSKCPLNVQLYKPTFPWIEEWLERDGRWEVTGDLNAVALLSRFDMKDLSEEEKEKGIPEARLVDIKYTADQPKRVREDIWRMQQEMAYHTT